MDRITKVNCTSVFGNEFPYSWDVHNHFVEYWLMPFLTQLHRNRKDAYNAIRNFIGNVKENFKQDYGNYIIPNIKEEWFVVVDYNDVNDD